jgi:predicted permease
MLVLFNIVLPVFIVIGAGYGAVRSGLLNQPQMGALMRFATTFAIPCLLFGKISTLDLSASINPGLLISFYSGALASFILTALLAKGLFKRRAGEAIAIGFAALFGNTLLLGLSIIERAYGSASMQPAFAIISVHAPFCFVLGITTMELMRANGKTLPATAKIVTRTIFSNALMIGIMLGYLVNLTGLPLPTPLIPAIDMLGRAALPTALFGLGGALVQYGLRGNLQEVALICISKLALHPAIAWVLATQVFHLPNNFTRAAVVLAAMAPGINAYVFANMYDRAKDTVAATILLATAISILSASLWLHFLGT